MPIGTSTSPVLRDLAGEREDLGALALSEPMPANHSPPLRMIGAMLAKVSTLLISVGLPHRPLTAGYGGRGLGVPRLPSIEAISAVSSPQTNAPAPRRISTSKLKGVLQMLLPSSPRRRASRKATRQPADRQRILRADIDVALACADRVGGDRHAFEHALRIAFQNAAIHERAGVALVAVADHVLQRRRQPWPPCPTSGRSDSRRRRGRAARSP